MLGAIKFCRIGVAREELDAAVEVLDEDRESGGVPVNAPKINSGAEASTPDATGWVGG